MKAPSSLLRSVMLAFSAFTVLLGLYIGIVEVSLQSLERAESSANLSAESWEKSYQRSLAIAGWAPLNASAQDLAARLAQRGAAEFASSPSDSIRLHQSAVEFGTKSLQLRPAWAVTWLNLAASEFVLDANGPAWRAALSRVFEIRDRNLRSQLAMVKFRKQIEAKQVTSERQQFQAASAQAQLDYPYDFTIAVIRLARSSWVCPKLDPLTYDPNQVLSEKNLVSINSICENSLN